MRTHIVVFLTVLSFLYFSIPRIRPVKPGIHPKLQKHFIEFNLQAKKYRKDWKIPKINIDIQSLRPLNIFNPESWTLGVCNYVTTNIIIDAEFVERFPGRVEEVVFHELGHCVLKRGHKDLIKEGTPISLMNSYLLSSKIYDINREYYIKELFSN